MNDLDSLLKELESEPFTSAATAANANANAASASTAATIGGNSAASLGGGSTPLRPNPTNSSGSAAGRLKAPISSRSPALAAAAAASSRPRAGSGSRAVGTAGGVGPTAVKPTATVSSSAPKLAAGLPNQSAQTASSMPVVPQDPKRSDQYISSVEVPRDKGTQAIAAVNPHATTADQTEGKDNFLAMYNSLEDEIGGLNSAPPGSKPTTTPLAPRPRPSAGSHSGSYTGSNPLTATGSISVAAGSNTRPAPGSVQNPESLSNINSEVWALEQELQAVQMKRPQLNRNVSTRAGGAGPAPGMGGPAVPGGPTPARTLSANANARPIPPVATRTGSNSSNLSSTNNNPIMAARTGSNGGTEIVGATMESPPPSQPIPASAQGGFVNRSPTLQNSHLPNPNLSPSQQQQQLQQQQQNGPPPQMPLPPVPAWVGPAPTKDQQQQQPPAHNQPSEMSGSAPWQTQGQASPQHQSRQMPAVTEMELVQQQQPQQQQWQQQQFELQQKQFEAQQRQQQLELQQKQQLEAQQKQQQLEQQQQQAMEAYMKQQQQQHFMQQQRSEQNVNQQVQRQTSIDSFNKQQQQLQELPQHQQNMDPYMQYQRQMDERLTQEQQQQIQMSAMGQYSPKSQQQPAMPLMPPQQQSVNSAPVPMKNCAACSNPIDPSQTPPVEALGRLYHAAHFVCSGCEINLANRRAALPEQQQQADGSSVFYERDGEPFCESCYMGAFGTRCAYCEEVITEKCITALGASWHPHHFFCSCCGDVFKAGAGFLEKDGRAYCEVDYFQLFSSLCQHCQKPILGEYVSAMDAEFHIECFSCADCKRPFPDGVFFELDGQPYCEEHYQLRSNDTPNRAGLMNHPNHLCCPTCGKPEPPPLTPGVIVDRVTKRRYCAGHYVCGSCGRGLKGGVVLVVVNGMEREAGLTRGPGDVAARAGDDGDVLLCEQCV